jgi:hypothetical protein
MFNQIIFPRIGWGELYECEDLTGHISDDAWWERYNFKRCPRDLDAAFEFDYSPRPDHLTDPYNNECEFCVSTGVVNAYLIPSKKRAEFALPTEATTRFTRTFAYARGNRLNEKERWRMNLG